MNRTKIIGLTLAFALFLPCAVKGGTGAENPLGTLSLREALRLALLQNPDLAAAETEIRAAEARRLQAGLLPNPVLEATAENVAGSGAYRGGRATEGTLQLNQLVEVGGKRAARLAVAGRGRQLAGFDYESKRLEVLSRTTGTFVQVLAAQRRLVLAQETRRLTESVIPAIERRVEIGAANAVELSRARTAAASVRIEESQAERDLAQSRGRLAANWGAREARFSSVVGDLERLPGLPSLAELGGRLDSNPAVARFPVEIERRRAELSLAQANAVPDPTFGIAYRGFAETGDSAAVFQLSIPLALFNRNQGNIREARVNILKAAQLRDAAVAGLSSRVNDAYRTAQAARREIDILRDKVLPGAEEAFRLLNDGYALGRFSQLDLIDSRRVLVTARGQLLIAQSAYHQALAELAGLTGNPTTGPRSATPNTTTSFPTPSRK